MDERHTSGGGLGIRHGIRGDVLLEAISDFQCAASPIEQSPMEALVAHSFSAQGSRRDSALFGFPFNHNSEFI